MQSCPAAIIYHLKAVGAPCFMQVVPQCVCINNNRFISPSNKRRSTPILHKQCQEIARALHAEEIDISMTSWRQRSYCTAVSLTHVRVKLL